MYQLDANNFIMILSHKWPLHVSDIYMSIFRSSYIFLTYIYDARSHLYQICDMNFKNILDYIALQLLQPITSDVHAARCTHISLRVWEVENFK